MDGKQWEVVSSGYRNIYDGGVNADGELFTYDADMEMTSTPGGIDHTNQPCNQWQHGAGEMEPANDRSFTQTHCQQQ